MGFEPTNAGTTIRCVNPFATLTIRVFSFSQTSEIQTLVEGVGFEPTKHSATDLQSAPFGHFGTPPRWETAFSQRAMSTLPCGLDESQVVTWRRKKCARKEGSSACRRPSNWQLTDSCCAGWNMCRIRRRQGRCRRPFCFTGLPERTLKLIKYLSSLAVRLKQKGLPRFVSTSPEAATVTVISRT